ncbi:MAG: hypothetical protein QF752_16025 [Planctomycetota bacterium]|nr:hypothetical protein [Planctomycetota bacterium]
MSRCELEVLIEEPNRVFRPGETIRGQVLVDVNADCRCDGLSLRPTWSTHGRGNRDGGKGEAIQLFQGLWTAGDELLYPFEIEAPSEPMTYHGHLINIDWYLKASADIPWAFDPKAEREFSLGPGDRSGSGSEGVAPAELSGASRSSGVGCLYVLVIIFLLRTLVPSLTMGTLWVPEGSFFLLLLMVGVAAYIFRNRIVEYRLGKVEFSLEPHPVVGGDVAIGRLMFQPRRSVRVDRIHLSLTGQEVAVSGSGSQQTTHTHTLREESFDMLEAGTRYMRGQRVEFEEEIHIPEEAAPSFDFNHNRVSWTLNLRIVLPGWPDYVISRKLHVLR